jgi:Amt family ammonium transporter
MFGAGNGFIGWHDPLDATKSWFFLQNIDATRLQHDRHPVLAHWLFQFAFADCASTICSGTMIGRTAFWGDILYSSASPASSIRSSATGAGARTASWR